MPIYKQISTIQVDVDNLWCYLADLGLSEGPTSNVAIYEYGVRRFLCLFDKFDIKATFFCIGKDAQNSKIQCVLKEIVQSGHEIANHSMNHLQHFSYLGLNAKKMEIENADLILRSVINTDIVGFKSPGWFLDRDTLIICKKLGYLYDSSVLPSFFSPLMALGRFVLSGGIKTGKKYSRFSFGIAPLKPYYPNERFPFVSYKGGVGNLIEVPTSTIPLLRFPFHSTFIFIFGIKLFELGLKLWNMRTPLNYCFHAIDLLPDNIEKRLGKNPTLGVSEKKRISVVEYILDKIIMNWEVLPSRKLAVLCQGLRAKGE